MFQPEIILLSRLLILSSRLYFLFWSAICWSQSTMCISVLVITCVVSSASHFGWILTLILVYSSKKQTERQTDRQGERGKHSVFMARHLIEPFSLKRLTIISLIFTSKLLKLLENLPNAAPPWNFTSPVVQQAARVESLIESPVNQVSSIQLQSV